MVFALTFQLKSLKSTIVPLFEKVLSASDAGRIGRLVLPKACAEVSCGFSSIACLPCQWLLAPTLSLSLPHPTPQGISFISSFSPSFESV